uniref:Peptidase S1 domain-containing protein n=1 Tax=Equus caballus TaxID=9796 RepID=A0A3Q2HXU6_HORSE
SKDTRKYGVLVGSLQVVGRPDSKTTIIPVSRIIPHPEFQENISSAIAVAELAYPVSFSPVILPICLPSSGVQLKNSTSCWVIGWSYSGIYQYRKPSYTLKELKVPLTDLQTCSDYYQKETLLHRVKPNISEARICSKLPEEQMDQCIGSRGDPLMCHVEDFWVLAGVVNSESKILSVNKVWLFLTIISHIHSFDETGHRARTWHCSSNHGEVASHMLQLEGPTTKNTQLCTRGLWGEKEKK